MRMNEVQPLNVQIPTTDGCYARPSPALGKGRVLYEGYLTSAKGYRAFGPLQSLCTPISVQTAILQLAINN
jgi:hypothetical protein